MKITQVVLIPALLLTLGLATSCSAQNSGELSAEVEELRANQKALREELDELKLILAPVLERLPKPFRPQDVTTAGSPSMGSDSAKIVVVEFSDLQCPYCVRFYDNTFPDIVKKYVDTGAVRYVAREFPLSSIHPEAARASEAALCAGDQDLYWDLRAKIFANRQNLSEEELVGYATEVGVKIEPWKVCMSSDRYSDKVKEDLADVAKLSITGTPSFVMGKADPSNPDKFHATKVLQGAVPMAQFEQAIDALLAE